MSRRRKPRDKSLTDRFLAGSDLTDEDESESRERFSARSKNAEIEKILRTAILRAEEQADADVNALPIGRVLQVYSLFSKVECGGRMFLCVVRKTLNRKSESAVLVGDRVRIRDLQLTDEQGQLQAVIELVLPRETVLTRADSFKGNEAHPIVANAQQMLIVVSLKEPAVRWGLVDRMIVAAESGKLRPIVCLNKFDLKSSDDVPEDGVPAQEILDYYHSIGIATLKTSTVASIGLDDLRTLLANQTTVVAGHSGVGKSTLLNAIQPQLRLRTGQISDYTGKGRHTTTSAQWYPLDFGGEVIDTPGVKLFGLWGVTKENLIDFFPDVADGNPPGWRQESYQRIAASLD